MVTAETALALPAVVAVALLVLGGVGAGITQMRVTDAARQAASAYARADSSYREIATAVGGPVRVTVSERGSLSCVQVSRHFPGPMGWAGWHAQAEACAYREVAQP